MVGGAVESLIAVTILAWTFILLTFLTMLAILTAQDTVIQKARHNVQQIKHIGGYILIGVGCWLVLLALFIDYFATIFPV